MISTDKSLLDFEVIYRFISSESYWGFGRSREVMQKAINNSAYCFGVYQKIDNARRQVGFARVITDLATFGYIADVFILRDYRGKGLGRWLIQSIVNHPELAILKRLALFTKTPDFYYNANFKIFEQTDEIKFMERKIEQ
ncbi:GNAT family N-acetyltransferase [Sporomusa carbonis]|uniref:GNAT family N-acetyltransferase n=1 Tax=Sporomusa carbonis TaxID=3076075 RepID=UPI003C7A7C0F